MKITTLAPFRNIRAIVCQISAITIMNFSATDSWCAEVNVPLSPSRQFVRTETPPIVSSSAATRDSVANPLLYSSYLGGSEDEGIFALDGNENGQLIVGGTTISTDFPITEGAFDNSIDSGNVYFDAFVACISRNGEELIFCTYLGGARDDLVSCLQIQEGGEALIAGTSASDDFPTSENAYDRTRAGELYNPDIFFAKLSEMGDALIFSTYFGGNCYECPFSMVSDGQGGAIITGIVTGDDMPVTEGSFDETYNEGYQIHDAFVAHFYRDGSDLLYSTYLGGSGNDLAQAIVLAEDGEVVITGYTESDDFPTTEGGLYSEKTGGRDVFIARLNWDASELLYSTFFGGRSDDEAYALALDSSGVITFAGHSRSDDHASFFPITDNAYQQNFGEGYSDAFIASLNPAGDSLIYSTYLGGRSSEFIFALTSDGDGGIVAIGTTKSPDFPTTPSAYDTSLNGGALEGDAFIVRLSRDGSNLLYGTYFGGWDGFISPYGIELDNAGGVYFVGLTNCEDLPCTETAFDITFNGGNYDGFVANLEIGLPYSLRWNQMSYRLECNEENYLIFDIEGESFDADADLTLALQSENLPLEFVVFRDHGEGKGSLEWETTDEDAGSYLATFTLTDGDVEITADVIIKVNDINKVPSPELSLPARFVLETPFPNPFNSVVNFKFGLPVAGIVNMQIYDLSGRVLDQLASGNFVAGWHDVSWNASGMPAGMYIVMLKVHGSEFRQKVCLIR